MGYWIDKSNKIVFMYFLLIIVFFWRVLGLKRDVIVFCEGDIGLLVNEVVLIVL